MQYKVSIGVPVYNVSAFIEKCAISLFEQTYKNIEYIFVNDCTPDNSIEILESVIERYPERKECVKIITHDRNRGSSAARNTFIEACTGDFLTHVDSDDWLDTKAIEKWVAKQQEGDFDILTSDAYYHYPKKKVYLRCPDYESSEDMAFKVLYSHPSIWGKLVRVKLYHENGIRCKEGVNNGEDYQILTQLAHFSSRVTNVHEPLYQYNCMNTNSYVSNISQKALEKTVDSHFIVKEFYDKLGPSYKTYSNMAELQGLLYATRLDDYNRFQYAIAKLHSLPRELRQYVPKSKRIVFYFKNQRVIHLYYTLAMSVKKLYNSIV